MKKFLIILFSLIGLITIIYFVNPYTIKTICFGDVCPQNGGTFLLYKKAYTKEECVAKGTKPITGIGWVEVYAGCSPDNFLSKLIDKKNN